MASSQEFEVDFLQGMITHHAEAVHVAGIGAEKATRAELKELSETAGPTQSAEIDLMQRWLEQWHGSSFEPTLPAGAQEMAEQLSKASGPDFDARFAQHLIEHHESAVRMAEDAAGKVQRPELADFCVMVRSAQTDQIKLLKLWLQQWGERAA